MAKNRDICKCSSCLEMKSFVSMSLRRIAQKYKEITEMYEELELFEEAQKARELEITILRDIIDTKLED